MIGTHIKNRRIKLNLSLKETADNLDISIQRLNNFETEVRKPPLTLLDSLSKTLDFDINNINKKRSLTNIDCNLFSTRLYEYRTKHNLTQNELSGKLNCTRQTLSKWEKGTSIPNIDDFYNLCKVLKIKPSSLIATTHLKKNHIYLLTLIPIILSLIVMVIILINPNSNTNNNQENYPSLPEKPKEEDFFEGEVIPEKEEFLSEDTISFINGTTSDYITRNKKEKYKISFNDQNLSDIYYENNIEFLLPYYFDNEKFIDHYLYNGEKYSALTTLNYEQDLVFTPVYIYYDEYMNSLEYTLNNNNKIVITKIPDKYRTLIIPKYLNGHTDFELRKIPTHIKTVIACENYLVFDSLEMNYLPDVLIFNCKNIELINGTYLQKEIEFLALKQKIDYNYSTSFNLVQTINYLYIRLSRNFKNRIIFECKMNNNH